MECSKLGFQIWAIAIFLIATNLKGISSMKLHRDLGITQKSAWFLAHRIRETFDLGLTYLSAKALKPLARTCFCR